MYTCSANQNACAIHSSMRKASITFGIFLGISLLLVASSPLTKPASLSEAFQLSLATLLLHICGAILFLFAIKSFRPSLRNAYRFMAFGASMLLLGVVIIYALLSAGLSEKSWADTATGLPFVGMAVAFYVGVRSFARLIGAQSVLLNAKYVYLVSATAGVVVGLLGSRALDAPVALVAIRFFDLLLFVWGAMLAFQVWRLASPFYKSAFTWLTLFLGMTVFHTTCGFLQVFSWMRWFNEASILVYLVAGFLVTMAAWRFNRLAYAEKSGRPVPGVGAPGAKTSVDVVVFLAGFASNPTQVDRYLDAVRSVTSSVNKDGLSEAQQMALAKAYLQIEDFLVNTEPLRKFERKDLRQMIDLQFKEAVNEPAFWKQIPIDEPAV